ncbi:MULTISPECIES: EscU/YscU/HrcU family type III secretion system export apparatus switch protein [Falsihalocynthiibacter]|uniref:Flagellar biosynthesis protein FlhB n=1 Tax=Falsihalocynthiibacter arcticus TaxID=1579316 RepID=A0A126UY80_9RHOB|nr:flagellar type III secretion system protein FlhB [Falsihalocynthiibacter arcticus]AML51023.1 flagellar biosynthesis protein FlhB [Falsihalocynthiibacter arcticus]
MSDDDDDDKQHEPTQKKLDDARKKGEVPKSTDLMTAAGYGGFLVAAYAVGSSSMKDMGQLLASIIGQSDRIAPTLFEGNGLPVTGSIMMSTLKIMSPWFALPSLLVIVMIVAQKSFVVAPDKLAPKLSRISPISNAKNKFGRAGIFEFFKSFVKLGIYGVVLGVFLYQNVLTIVATVHMTPAMATTVLLELVMKFFFIVLIIATTLGVLDFLFQYQEHMRKNRMSHKDMKDEHKNSEGDPHVKQKRRQKGYEIAMSQMMSDVGKADVIIVNPTHYAVALKWDRANGGAPICVAKGVDEVAATIRELASEHGVPIHSDPPTARAIFAVVEIGHEIHATHYQAVAAAIRFAEKIRKKARGYGVKPFG